MKSDTAYGRDALERAAFVTPLEVPARPSRTQRVLTASALLLTAGAAFLALHASSSAPFDTHIDAFSMESVPVYVVPPVLQTSRELLLRTRSKPDWCLDDSGAMAAGQGKLALWQCNPNSANQLFVYNAATYQLRSARKTNLCLDLSGAGAQLQTCNTASTYQRFTYNATSLQVRAPAKPNMCLDDGSGSAARCSASRFVFYYCDAASANQRFDVVFRDDAQAAQQRTVDAAQDGHTRFQIRAVGKNNLCLDDDGAVNAGDTQLKLATCAPDSSKQQWVWDLTLKRIRSVQKHALCLDDGGAVAALSTVRMTLGSCDASNKNQEFVYDKTQLTFRNPNKANLCIDDGGVWTLPSLFKMQLGTCDPYNANQHFEYVLLPPPAAVDTPAVLQDTREFLLRLRDKNSLCVDDGGGVNEGDSALAAWPCSPSNANQGFTYDAKTNQLRSARRPALCLDDGGAASPYSTAVTSLRACDAYSLNQRFAYDNATQQFRNPLKTNLCLDDGGSVRAGDTQPGVRACDSASPNQRFAVVFRTEIQTEQQRVLDAVARGAKFVLRAVGKDNLCVNGGGAYYSGWSQMGLSPCAFDNMDQVFLWDTTTRRIQSFANRALCVDDGGATAPSTTRMTLVTCNAANPNQDFVLDVQQLLFRNTNKPALCIDDGGAWAASYGTLQLAACNLYSPNQHFEYVLVPPLPVFPTPPELTSDREFLLRLPEKDALCVHDGGAVRAEDQVRVGPWPCNPSDENELFVYNNQTNQIRSARKANLCVDDAGTTLSGQFRAVMGACDADSPNQRFVYDPLTQQFRNPLRTNLCLDDGGATRGGSSQFTLWTCDPENPNQHFEIQYREAWAAAQQRTVDAAAAGATVLIRAVGKENLCVDDGGGTTTMALATCDATSNNQRFVWEADSHHMRSVSKGLCMDTLDGTMTLYDCSHATVYNAFAYDAAALALHIVGRADVCLDDGGAWSPFAATLMLSFCNGYSPNQRFEFVLAP